MVINGNNMVINDEYVSPVYKLEIMLSFSWQGKVICHSKITAPVRNLFKKRYAIYHGYLTMFIGLKLRKSTCRYHEKICRLLDCALHPNYIIHDFLTFFLNEP